MSAIIVVGAQWGDEGKGKIIDVLSEKADCVVRFQGGANAGHTLVVGGKKTILHLIPSGVLHPGVMCLIGPGCVVDVDTLLKELRGLKEAGALTEPKRVRIADNATVILPFHKVLDAARESALGDNKIGTTGRGIGPAYEDRVARRAILFSDLFDDALLREKLSLTLKEKNILLEHLYKQEPVSIEKVVAEVQELRRELEDHRVRDVGYEVQKTLAARKRVLFEGAQGTLLDVYHGTYPFVTSSSTVAGAACSRIGVGPTKIQHVIGITKAYTTRVGSGPFPTELPGEVGEQLRSFGQEFGSTTGRARRCGWLDLVALKYAIQVNGITSLALMKLDVLSHFKEVGVCVGYELRGETLNDFPASSLKDLKEVKPIIKMLPGWSEDLTKVTSTTQLPRACTHYIDFIGKYLGCPIDVISVGPGREQTLWIKPLFQ